MATNDVLTKTCSVCGIEKYLIDFDFNMSRGNYDARCMECRRSANRRIRYPERSEYDGESQKICSKCGKSKPLIEYNFRKVSGTFYTYCKSCANRISENCRLKNKYGITIDQLDAAISAQDGKCMICEAKFGDFVIANVDHNAATGQVRGILCRTCNTLLGMYKENLKILRACGYEKHAEYLEKFL